MTDSTEDTLVPALVFLNDGKPAGDCKIEGVGGISIREQRLPGAEPHRLNPGGHGCPRALFTADGSKQVWDRVEDELRQRFRFV